MDASAPYAEMRDKVARAIYLDPNYSAEAHLWESMSEDRREPWRTDADRAIEVLTRNSPLVDWAQDRLALAEKDLQEARADDPNSYATGWEAGYATAMRELLQTINAQVA